MEQQTGCYSRYIHGQFDLSGKVMKVADINVKSIKSVEAKNETPEDPPQTYAESQLSEEHNIQAEVCDDGSTTQIQTVEADPLVTGQELLDDEHPNHQNLQ